ncbi:MAG: glycosyltransferase family 9 protein, partial [Flavobacteriales bacterium]|nr:glycosyltransferase family 9 protein [Flavobacteriales bacterium]
GNEGLLQGHPFVKNVIVWDKQENKYSNMMDTISRIRENRYERVINLQRFASTGIMTWRSGAVERVGFAKNPFAWSFTRKVEHEIADQNGKAIHEIERNHRLIDDWVQGKPSKPRLYPSNEDEQKVKGFIQEPFVTMSPSSVWATKQLPLEKWQELIRGMDNEKVFLLGGPGDAMLCNSLAQPFNNVQVLAGKLSLLQSAALMRHAKMNYVNDSAPLHLASAMNAPVTAFFCSTIPAFGFGPLSDDSYIGETEKNLECRPCGLHGKAECPLGHFDCGHSIDVSKLRSVSNVAYE